MNDAKNEDMDNIRALKAARGLFRRYANPETAALNASRAAKSERARVFWLFVISFLARPYPGQCWTDEEIRRWALIRA